MPARGGSRRPLIKPWSLLRPLAGPDAGSESTTRDRWLLAMALTDRGVASREAGDRDRAAHDFDEAARVAGSVAQDDEIL